MIVVAFRCFGASKLADQMKSIEMSGTIVENWLRNSTCHTSTILVTTLGFT